MEGGRAKAAMATARVHPCPTNGRRGSGLSFFVNREPLNREPMNGYPLPAFAMARLGSLPVKGDLIILKQEHPLG